jgi:adenine deaminase
MHNNWGSIEKISMGMMIMLRESSASHDFNRLDQLIELKPDSIMFCTDDCHPDDLQLRNIDDLVRRSIIKGYSLFNIFKGSTLNAINHYKLNVGYLQPGDSADFIIVDNLKNFNILETFIEWEKIYDGEKVDFPNFSITSINKFYLNMVSVSDIQIKSKPGKDLHIIEIISDSLLTKHKYYKVTDSNEFFESDISNDILKIVVVNRYSNAKTAVGFIKGFK